MLKDAFSAEAFKLTRNRALLFWAFGFVPLLALIPSLIGELMIRSRSQLLPPVNLDHQALRTVADAASPVTAFFCLLGAAVIFGGDYRWETWRLMATRNSRLNLMAGKAMTFAVACAVSLLLIAAGQLASGLLGAALDSSTPQWNAPALPFAGRFAGLFGLGWLQLLQVGGLAALAAVVTRSMLPAIFAPIVLMVTLLLVQQKFLPVDPADADLWRLFAFPGFSAELVKVHLLAVDGPAPLPLSVVTGATAALIAWALAGWAAAAVLFNRQDLGKE